MTDWATKFIPAEQTPPQSAIQTENASFNLLVEVIQDTIRETLANELPESESSADSIHDDRMDRVLLGLASLSEGLSQQLLQVVRRIDELERILDQSLNEVPMTNLMQDAPSVYERVMETDLDEEVEEDSYEEVVGGDDLHSAYEAYLNEEIKWTEFVKMAGGVSNAVLIREDYDAMHSGSDDAAE